MTSRHEPKLRIVAVDGEPSAQERRSIEAALAKMVQEERHAREASIWKRAGRAQGRRLGNFDYRDRFSSVDAWRLSTRFPFGGREYPGLNGRGDAK